MPLIPVSTIDDPRLAVFRNLHTSKMERKSGVFIAEGMWLVRRLLESRFETLAILADHRRLDEIGVPVPDSTVVYLAPDGLTEQVVGFNFHRGIVACGRRVAPRTLAHLGELGPGPWLIVACADIQDPENIGGILRNAAAFGAHAVVLGPNCSDPLSRRVLRVSMGASLRLPVCESGDLFADLARLRAEQGATVAATVLDEAATPLEATRHPGHLVLVFGCEGHGLPRDWWEFADWRLTIPMHPFADSLNVAVASGLFLYHFQRIASPVPASADGPARPRSDAP